MALWFSVRYMVMARNLIASVQNEDLEKQEPAMRRILRDLCPLSVSVLRYSPRVMSDAYVVRRPDAPEDDAAQISPTGGWSITTLPTRRPEPGRKIGLGGQGACAPPRSEKAPTAAIIDSQSVKTASQPEERGFDAGKKTRGRKATSFWSILFGLDAR